MQYPVGIQVETKKVSEERKSVVVRRRLRKLHLTYISTFKKCIYIYIYMMISWYLYMCFMLWAVATLATIGCHVFFNVETTPGRQHQGPTGPTRSSTVSLGDAVELSWGHQVTENHGKTKGCLVHQTRRIFGAHGSQLTTVAVTRLRSTATLPLGVVGNGGVVLEGG